ncbi:MAG: adenosylmethionine--8-amino-7-oxononanoate transaminase [Phycisphaeraceae bacterium]
MPTLVGRQKLANRPPVAKLDAMSEPTPSCSTTRWAQLDHDHVWHPFTPMKQWRQSPPLIIERAQGDELIDSDGRRYLDGVSSLWCNVHGHRVPAIDQAIRDQLDKVAHTTLLGLASPPSIELAAQLIQRATPTLRLGEASGQPPQEGTLNKVFYSDAGATALEVAFKMAVGYWFHKGQLRKSKFIGLEGAYHGDTTGSMAVGYSELFHRPYQSLLFPSWWFPAPDAPRAPRALQVDVPADVWPSEHAPLTAPLADHCLAQLAKLLESYADDTAAIVIEPVMQGAAGMICQPAGFVKRVAELARRYNVLLIADEVAVGFGRTGAMFACQHDGVRPDILCLAKGITGGYLPLAATLATDAVYDAFTGEQDDHRTLYHGHTYTGNALACAAALASLALFDETDLLTHINANARLMARRLDDLRPCPHVLDIRQRGVMVGIELCRDRTGREPFDFSKRTGHALCAAMREQGLIVRPLGDVLVLMPIPAMKTDNLQRMMDIVIQTVLQWRFE